MSFHLPSEDTLHKLHVDIDEGIDAVTKVLDFVEKYGAIIPGVKGYLSVVEEIDAALKTAKAFLDKVPV